MIGHWFCWWLITDLSQNNPSLSMGYGTVLNSVLDCEVQNTVECPICHRRFQKDAYECALCTFAEAALMRPSQQIWLLFVNVALRHQSVEYVKV